MFGFNKLKKSEKFENINKKTKADREFEKKYFNDLEKLNGVKIEADPYKFNGQEYQLTKELLAQCDLAPDGRFELGGREIKISKSFKVGERDCIIGYVEDDDGGFKARSYYRSNSQGVWRYLPDYVERHEALGTNPDGTKIEGRAIGGAGWYGKGYDEASLTLPTEMQRALNWEVEERPSAEIGDVLPEFLMCGTACRYESKRDYQLAKQSGTLVGDYYREVRKTPKFAYNPNRRDKIPPNSLRILDAYSPDFNYKTNEYNYESALVGATDAEVFSSKDGNLQWTLCSDQRGQSWVGNVEVASPITSTGLRRDWCDPGDLATPLYEYRSQSGGYGNESDRKGNYVNMWNNYLSRSPIIRDYQYSKLSKSSKRPF